MQFLNYAEVSWWSVKFVSYPYSSWNSSAIFASFGESIVKLRCSSQNSNTFRELPGAAKDWLRKLFCRLQAVLPTEETDVLQAGRHVIMLSYCPDTLLCECAAVAEFDYRRDCFCEENWLSFDRKPFLHEERSVDNQVWCGLVCFVFGLDALWSLKWIISGFETSSFRSFLLNRLTCNEAVIKMKR